MKDTIKSKDRITWLFDHGSRYAGTGFFSLYGPGENKEGKNTELGRVAYVAGKKLGTAPRRSRAKRRLREAARAAGAPWSGFDVVLVAQRSIYEAEFVDLVFALECLGKKLKQEGQRGGSAPDHLEGTKENLLDPFEGTKENEKKKTVFSYIVGIPRHLALVCISIYRHAISPLLPPSCRYVPSCSEYASIAIKRFGFLRGTWLSVKRVGRCHPFRPGGYDPVPEEMGKKLA